MKRPLGVLVIAMTGWVLSAALLLAVVGINYSPEKFRGMRASFCFFAAVLIAVVSFGLFRLNYWARVTMLVMTSSVLLVSAVSVFDYAMMPLRIPTLDREVRLGTVLFWVMSAGVIWYFKRPSIKKAFGISPE